VNKLLKDSSVYPTANQNIALRKAFANNKHDIVEILLEDSRVGITSNLYNRLAYKELPRNELSVKARKYFKFAELFDKEGSIIKM
jgi:hypothetical protein